MTRYRKSQRMSFQVENGMNMEVISISPNITLTDVLIKQTFRPIRTHDYLPKDCWQLIINKLCPISRLIAKVTCKLWNKLLLNASECEKVNIEEMYLIYGWYYGKFFYDLCRIYGIRNIHLSLDNTMCLSDDILSWLICEGATYDHTLLTHCICATLPNTLKILISKGEYFRQNFYIQYSDAGEITFPNKEILKILLINNMMIQCDNKLIPMYY